jgi:hypothetical protein
MKSAAQHAELLQYSTEVLSSSLLSTKHKKDIHRKEELAFKSVPFDECATVD